MKWPWNRIEREIKNRAAVQSARDAGEFWSDFNARASLRHRESPAPVQLPLIYGWSLATACATLLLVIAGVYMMSGRAGAGGSTINSFNIDVKYSAAVVTQGGDGQAAMLWVMDMDPDAPEENTL